VNDGQRPNVRGVRVRASTGYNRERFPEIPTVTIRNFSIAVSHGHVGT
jgi:hypothetical protein